MLTTLTLYLLSYHTLVGLAVAIAAPGQAQSTQHIPFSLRQEYRLNDIDTGDYGHGAADTQTLFTTTSFNGPSDAHPLSYTPTSLVLAARTTTVWRPRDHDLLEHARLRSLHMQESERVEWEQIEMPGPDVEDKHTLGQLARMTANAYAMPGQDNWFDLDMGWNKSFPYGWEDDQDGFRGHVFVAPGNSTVILSIKGTPC